MAGTLACDTIQNGAGTSVPTTTVISGSAKAWVNFDGGRVNSVGTIYGSFNVSSITYITTGTYVVNFTNALADANYAFAGGGEYYPTANGLMCVSCYARTTTAIYLNVDYANTTNYNPDRVNVVCFR